MMLLMVSCCSLQGPPPPPSCGHADSYVALIFGPLLDLVSWCYFCWLTSFLTDVWPRSSRATLDWMEKSELTVRNSLAAWQTGMEHIYM